MKQMLKSIGALAIGVVILLCLICLAMLFICGGVWMSATVLPALSVVASYTFLLCLFVLIPLAVFHSTRGFAGVTLFIASYTCRLCTMRSRTLGTARVSLDATRRWEAHYGAK